MEIGKARHVQEGSRATVVSYGRGSGVVVATGMRTQLGMIADMLQQVDTEQTPLQKRLDQLGKLLGWGALAVCGVVFLVGLLNTLLVAGLGAVLATILGFVIGIARLSPNWLLARLAGGYVELVRNLPLLFQILFWYLAVLGTLPGPRQSISLFGEIYLNNRGAIVPAPVFGPGASYVTGQVIAVDGGMTFV